MKNLFFFFGEGGQMLDQVARRGYEDAQNPTGHGLEQPALADPALSRELEEVISRDLFHTQHFWDPAVQTGSEQ